MSASKKKILLNAFNMNCIGHINHGLWTHPRDNSTQYKTIEYWTELAQLLERGLFDGLFIADIVGVYDVYQNAVDVPLKESIQLPVNDPLLLVSAMAAVTRNLGFGLTANLTYEPPYLFARRMSTLDHLSRGRVGWNIVTGYLDSAAKAMGLSEQVEHDRRYDQADEYLEVLYKLWEGSWENGAVLNDPKQRIYAQPDKVHRIEHKGEFYQVEGYHLCEPSPQRTPVLFQAGSSDRGLLFAGRHAECVFISGQNKPSTKVQVDKVRASAVEAGRNPEDIKVFMGLNVIVGATEELAWAKHAEYLSYASAEAGVAHFSASTGIDFSEYAIDEPIQYVKSNAIQSATKNLGFGLTANLTYEPPYLFARRMSTLDHLTRGRVGWNIVTGYLDSAAKAMGLTEQVEHDRRYDQADEYLEVLYKLWEGSWENDAVLNDPAQRIYARPDKVHKVKHAGEFYQVEGYHLCEPSPQRTPVLFQAGSSDRGLAFAGRHAECVFISGQTKAATKLQVDRVRASAAASGRNPDDIKVFMGLNVIVAPTEALALAKREEYLAYASAEAGVAHFSSSTGIDFADYELDEPIQYVKSNAIQSATKVLQNNDWTRRKLLEQHALGGRYITVVGSPEQVADELESWIGQTGLDGFNLTRIVTPESYADFIDLVIPELQRRGSYKTAYDTGSLRQKLFVEGDAHLPERHTGASFRP